MRAPDTFAMARGGALIKVLEEEMRENLSRVEREVWRTVLTETVAQRPPMPGRLAELTGNSRKAVFRAIDHLKQRGMVAQPYERGPILPCATRDGLPIRIMVVFGDPEVLPEDALEGASLPLGA